MGAKRKTLPRAPELVLKYLYDYHACIGEDAMRKTVAHINQQGYELVSVTHDGEKFFIFWRGPAYG